MGHVPIDSPGKVVRTVRRSLARRAARPLRLRAPGRKRRADRRPLGARPRGDGRVRRAVAPARRQGHRRRQVRRRDGPDDARRRAPPRATRASARTPPSRRWPSSSRCSARRTAGSPPGRPRRSATAPRRCCCASGDAARRLGLTPRARIVDQTTVGVDPIIMLTGPIPATRKLLRAQRPRHRRHRPVRGQRGVLLSGAGVAARAAARHGPGQRQRRGDRARPPRRRDRRQADRHPASPSSNAATSSSAW